MARWHRVLLLGMLLAGCRQQGGTTLSSLPTPAPAPQAAVAALPAAPADPDLARQAVPPAQVDAFRAIGARGGFVDGFSGLDEAPEGYSVQLLPENTQLEAERLAHAWADDARQVYVGWGFWKVHVLGKTRHVYYSHSKRQTFTVEYSFLKSRRTATVCHTDTMEQAFLVLRDAYDNGGTTASAAYRRAQQAGYRPHKYVTASLMHLVLVGPVWIFLDDLTMEPTHVVVANGGEVLTDGPLMAGVRYLIRRGLSSDNACAPYPLTGR